MVDMGKNYCLCRGCLTSCICRGAWWNGRIGNLLGQACIPQGVSTGLSVTNLLSAVVEYCQVATWQRRTKPTSHGHATSHTFVYSKTSPKIPGCSLSFCLRNNAVMVRIFSAPMLVWEHLRALYSWDKKHGALIRSLRKGEAFKKMYI